MADMCGNCDCSDKTQCVKKGTSYTSDFVETEKNFGATVVMGVEGAENGGKCKCGPSCSCVDCGCGAH